MPLGRPTVITSDILRKLEEYFSSGLSDAEACLAAGIGATTLYHYCQKNPDFRERKELLKEHPKIKAKMVINKALDDGDLATAWKYLERKDPEFRPKRAVDLNHSGRASVEHSVSPRMQAILDDAFGEGT